MHYNIVGCVRNVHSSHQHGEHMRQQPSLRGDIQMPRPVLDIPVGNVNPHALLFKKANINLLNSGIPLLEKEIII